MRTIVRYCKKGKEALDVAILKAYESGDFQGPKNKYTRARDVLYHMLEYKRYFNWRSDDHYDRIRYNRGHREEWFNDLLKTALKTQLPRDKYLLKVNRSCMPPYYLRRLTTRHAIWTSNIERAKIFRYAEDVENVKRCFENTENWEVVKRETGRRQSNENF